jgi:multiple sugar transport system substrate-binding protein
LNRREFLWKMLTLSGAGLLAAGLGDLLYSSRGAAPAPPVLTSSSTSTSASSQTLPDYADFLSWLQGVSGPYKGKTVNISLESEFSGLAVYARAPDFRSASGANDQYDLESYTIQLQDVGLAVETKSPSYDAFGIDCQNVAALKDGLVPVSQLIQDYPDLTYPGLNLAGFDQFDWDGVAQYPSDPSAPAGSNDANSLLLPFSTPTLVLFYRTDVWDSVGLSPPQTWDDYFDGVKTIFSSNAADFGAVSMAAQGVPIVYEYLVHLTSFGGALWEVEGNTLVPTLDTDEAVAALENFVRFKPYSDPGSKTYYWTDVFTSLSQGYSAAGLLWHDYLPWFGDPARTVIPGKFAVKQNPSGSAGSFSTIDASGIGVSASSNNPDLAWLWVQWATALGTQETLLLDQYHIVPTRPAVYSAPSVAEALTGPGYTAALLAKSIQDSGSAVELVSFPKWNSALNALAAQLSSAWQGLVTPDAALSTAQTQVEALGTLTF